MAEVIKMPRLSDTMEEGVVSQWLKKVGDKVSEGDILAEIETDKATMEFESFYDGTLLYIAIDEGVTADVDSLLCIIGEEGEDISKYLSLNEDEPKQLDLVDQINEQEESVSLEPVLISSEEQKPEKIVDDLVPSNQDNDIDFSIFTDYDDVVIKHWDMCFHCTLSNARIVCKQTETIEMKSSEIGPRRKWVFFLGYYPKRVLVGRT